MSTVSPLSGSDNTLSATSNNCIVHECPFTNPKSMRTIWQKISICRMLYKWIPDKLFHSFAADWCEPNRMVVTCIYPTKSFLKNRSNICQIPWMWSSSFITRLCEQHIYSGTANSAAHSLGILGWIFSGNGDSDELTVCYPLAWSFSVDICTQTAVTLLQTAWTTLTHSPFMHDGALTGIHTLCWCIVLDSFTVIHRLICLTWKLNGVLQASYDCLHTLVHSHPPSCLLYSYLADDPWNI